MRIVIGLLAAVLLVSPLRADQPTTKPSVLLLRFAQLNDSPGMEWVGRVMQESLLTDLARDPALQVNTSQQMPTTDIATARRIGHDAKADIIVTGGYQVIADDLKITGQAIDVQSGRIIGTLKSTATVRDCLAMEETLAHQLSAAISRQHQVEPSAQAKVDYEALGPVRVANYSRTFGQPKPDPFQSNRDRYMYGTPTCPYFFYGCGYGYGFGFPGFYGTSWITPTGTFYGD